MSKHQTFKNAIEAFQPGRADAPILYSTVEVNEKGFQALLGRKAKPRPMSVSIWISILIIIAISVVTPMVAGHAGTPTFAAFIPLFVLFFCFRTTLIAVGEKGLDFYFIEPKPGSTYAAYDKISLPYDRITNVKVRTGRFNTSFTFTFSSETKNYKINASIPNKMKKVKEHSENLKRLLEAFEKTS